MTRAPRLRKIQLLLPLCSSSLQKESGGQGGQKRAGNSTAPVGQAWTGRPKETPSLPQSGLPLFPAL